jgi:hypothetical protein
MKRAVYALVAVALVATACKKAEKTPEPAFVIAKWARAIQDLNYQNYARCEAYPKSEAVFRDMYRDYYLTDLMVTSVEEADEKDVRRDQDGNPFLHRSLSFEASAVKRGTGRPYQVGRGDAVFIKFTAGAMAERGWLMSNRTFITINR